MESTPSQTAEGMALVQVLAQVLERLVASNAHVGKTIPVQVTKFHALKAPAISILQYLERIHKYASCSTECFVFALIYIDRLIQRNNFVLTELNIHRVVITSVLLAAKFFDDSYYNNAYYAKVGGVPVVEMNGLELEFLFFVQFSLHVTPDVFSRYRNELISHTGWTAGVLIEQQTLFSSSASSPQFQQTSFIASTSIMYDTSITSQTVVNVVSSTTEPHGMEGVVSTSHAWTQEETYVSQISPSPPPSATSVSPTSCDDQDKTEEMLNIENLKYYSAPARYNTCLPPGSLNQSRHRSNSFPVAMDKVQYFNHSTMDDRFASQQQQLLPMEPCARVISHDHLISGMSHVRSSIPLDTIRSRTDMVRTSSHERCLSVPISPSTSSPRFMDTIVSSKS